MNHRVVGIGVALVAGLALGIALASEHWGGLVPCALCLWERWPYRVAIGFSILSAILPARVGRPVALLAALAMFAGAGLGVAHVGVEWGLWPSPLPECAAPDLSGLSIAERMARMPATPAKPCDEPTYLVPALPISMAAMNLLLAVAMTGGIVLALWRRPGEPKDQA